MDLSRTDGRSISLHIHHNWSSPLAISPPSVASPSSTLRYGRMGTQEKRAASVVRSPSSKLGSDKHATRVATN